MATAVVEVVQARAALSIFPQTLPILLPVVLQVRPAVAEVAEAPPITRVITIGCVEWQAAPAEAVAAQVKRALKLVPVAVAAEAAAPVVALAMHGLTDSSEAAEAAAEPVP